MFLRTLISWEVFALGTKKGEEMRSRVTRTTTKLLNLPLLWHQKNMRMIQMKKRKKKRLQHALNMS